MVGDQEVEDPSWSQRKDTHLVENVQDGTMLGNASNLASKDSKSDSKYMDATQLVEFVHKTQIDPTHKT